MVDIYIYIYDYVYIYIHNIRIITIIHVIIHWNCLYHLLPSIYGVSGDITEVLEMVYTFFYVG